MILRTSTLRLSQLSQPLWLLCQCIHSFLHSQPQFLALGLRKWSDWLPLLRGIN